MASREYETFLGALQSPLVSAADSLEEARAKLEAVHGHPVAAETRVTWTTLGGVRCAWVDVPEAAGSNHVLVLCHGGAFIAAGGNGYLFYAEMLGRACAVRMLLVDYRLAPVHRFPAALDDCAAAYRGLLAEGWPPAAIGLIGDSCGGGLALAALLRLREAGVALPALAVTLGGWLDLEASGDSARHPVGRDPFAAAEFIRVRGRDYVGPDGDLRDPLASPIHADPHGLPSLLLQVGQVDLTRDDAVRVAARAGQAGVDVTLEVHPEMVHGFQGLAAAGIPEAVTALARVATFVRARLA
jgi:acetyl esterase/lipase